MANQRQPIQLIEYKGRKHMTKEEIAERHATEVHAPCGELVPPTFLNAKQKAEFVRLAELLKPLDIVSDLDTGELARYCVAWDLYQRYTKRLNSSPKKLAKRKRREAEEKGEPIPKDVTDDELVIFMEQELSKLQAKYFEQCEKTAKALGLNITSRCRLIIPKPQEPPKANRFNKFEKSG